MKKNGVAFIFLVLFLGSNLFASDLQELKKKILKERMRAEEISKNLEEKKEKIKEIKAKEGQTISELNRVERRLLKKKKELRRIEGELTLTEKKIKSAQSKIEELSQHIRKLEAALEKRLVAFYKFGGHSYVSAIFSARSFPDLLRRYKYMEAIIDYDSQLMESYQQNLNQIKESQQKLKEGESKWNSSRDKIEKTRREIERERVSKVKILKAIQSKEKVHLKALKELEKASLSLQNLLERLEKEAARKAREGEVKFRGEGFAALKGSFSFPVKGRVIALFGEVKHTRFNTVTFHNGIDIEAPSGAEIRSIFGGKVLYSGWLKGYGNIMIIDHGDHYYSLFAHLSQLFKEVGDEVNKGEVVALVGDTGSLKGPCLYFEIRHHGKPEDPLDWLKVPLEKELASARLVY